MWGQKIRIRTLHSAHAAPSRAEVARKGRRYDIGDGNGSVFDYVRSTCSHDEFIEALNALETQLYFPGVTDSQRQFVEKTVEEATQNLKDTLKEKMEDLDKAQNEYKELHKKWLIEATEADQQLPLPRSRD